ncbi:MAG: hypothetical protein IH872_06100 [Chloroflexi bacterium]|nr:hypothetical protein [Chloroflexota bacterium]
MTIEVKQLLIKSSVLPEGGQKNTPDRDNDEDVDQTLAYVLEECRQMVVAMLRKERER